jgi:hypothetical protein
MPRAVITLSGLGPLDGKYDMPTDLNMGELFFVESTVGIKAGQIEDAVKAGSVGLLACMIALALKRAGFPDVPMSVLWEASDEQIDVEKVEDEGEENDGRPLDSQTPGGPASESAEPSSLAETG